MAASSRKKRIAIVLAGVAIVVFIAHRAFMQLSEQRAAQETPPAASPNGTLTDGMAMPEDVQLETTDAKKVSLTDFKGKVVLINFWAGWCGPCLHEMPGLFDLQKRLGPKGFVVLGMNMDDDPKSGLQTLKRIAGDAPFTNFHGMGSPLADKFGIDGLPFTVVLDKKFHIAYAHAGEVDWGGAHARDLLEGLL
jgi:thiol-disulfide isomerase/thioredoxin